MEIDYSQDPRFSVARLSEAIVNYPNLYGLLESLGLFTPKPIAETNVKVDIKNKQINIIPATPRGSPPPRDTSDTRGMKVFPTFRHALGFTLIADEFQNVRKFGAEEQTETEVFEEVLLEKLDDQQWKHRQTHEYLRWGALRGIVYDADGVTPLYNVYDEMGETQKIVEWDLLNDNAVDPIQDGTDETLDHMELNANGEPVSGVAMLCSPGYHSALMKNKAFREAYKYFEGQPNPHRDNLRRGFHHKGITYYRHLGSATFLAPDGTKLTHKFIPDNEAIGVPLGTRQVFRTYWAPADYNETVNTLGQELYAKIEKMKMDRGYEGETQSQSLHLVLKPRLVTRHTIKEI